MGIRTSTLKLPIKVLHFPPKFTLVGFPLEKEMKKCADALDYLESELKKL
jgi:hypothetical protein